MEDILTCSQVAKLLRMHVRTVYKLAQEGVIPGRKFGHSWRFSRKSILRMLGSGSEPNRRAKSATAKRKNASAAALNAGSPKATVFEKGNKWQG